MTLGTESGRDRDMADRDVAHRETADLEIGIAGLRAPGRHGDQDVERGMVDFSVNVRADPPPFLVSALADRLTDLGGYPTRADEDRARAAAAAAHGRSTDEVLPLSGAAEGFEMLPRLGVRHAAVIEPSFTEPRLVLGAAGIRVSPIVLPPPWRLEDAAARIPADADLVVVGNPTNPTSVLHPRAAVDGLRAPGRVVVVDEAFADVTRDDRGVAEPESLASWQAPDIVVIRSVTKTFGLAGLRAGYLLAAPPVVERLSAGRRAWPLGTLALTALAECLGPRGRRYSAEQAAAVARDRATMVATLRAHDVTVCAPPRASFVLVAVPDGPRVKAGLAERGFAVRSAANFTGLGDDHLRLAVRDPATVDDLMAAMRSVREGDR